MTRSGAALRAVIHSALTPPALTGSHLTSPALGKAENAAAITARSSCGLLACPAPCANVLYCSNTCLSCGLALGNFSLANTGCPVRRRMRPDVKARVVQMRGRDKHGGGWEIVDYPNF